MQTKKTVHLTYCSGLYLQKQKFYTPKTEKLGAIFAPFLHFLLYLANLCMQNLQKHHNFVPWVMTKILICHKHSFKEIFLGTFFDMGVF